MRKGEKLIPLASATGDVGLMQVNRQTWRGVYDVNGLSADIAYNGNAGSEILLYDLHYAISKEDRQRGGQLTRATYSAYNGGPRAVATGTPPPSRRSRKSRGRSTSDAGASSHRSRSREGPELARRVNAGT